MLSLLSMAKGPKCDGKYHTPATGLKRKQRGNTGEHHVPSIIATYSRETFQTTAGTNRQSTVRKLVLRLSELLFFYVGNCTCQ